MFSFHSTDFLTTPPPPPAPALGTSAGVYEAQARSSSSVLARPPTHCEAVAAGGSPSEDQRSNTHALFEQFIEFMNYRDSISTSRSVSSPAQTAVAAPVLTLAPAGPSEFANPPTTVPGPKLGFRSLVEIRVPSDQRLTTLPVLHFVAPVVLDGALTRAGLRYPPLGALRWGGYCSAFW